MATNEIVKRVFAYLFNAKFKLVPHGTPRLEYLVLSQIGHRNDAAKRYFNSKTIAKSDMDRCRAKMLAQTAPPPGESRSLTELANHFLFDQNKMIGNFR